MEDDGYAWMAPNVPPAPSLMAAAVAVSVIIGGCVPPPSTSLFVVLKQQFMHP